MSVVAGAVLVLAVGTDGGIWCHCGGGRLYGTGRRWCFRGCIFSNCFKSTVKSVGDHREGVESSWNAGDVFLGDMRRGVDAAGSKAFEMVTNVSEGITGDYWALMICEVWFLAFVGAGVFCEVFLFTLREDRALVVFEMLFLAIRASVL